MKTHKIFSLFAMFAIILSLSLITSCNDDEEEDETINREMLTTVELKVEGMTCTGCENTVTNAVMELSGINHIQVSHVNGKADVEFDKTKTSEEEIVKAITEVGYKIVD